MRALVIDRLAAPPQLRLAEIARPEPAPGEVRIRVAAAGINPADWKILERGWQGWTFPKIAGLDGAGIVDSVGDGVSGLRRGERVYWHGRLARLGAYAEYVCIDAVMAVPLPSALTFVLAAALPTAAFTAYQIVEVNGRVAMGDIALVNAAAGGVGVFALQLLKRRGARVVGVASAANHDFIRAYGADETIDYRSEDVEARIGELTHGVGLDIAIDLLGPESGGRLLKHLAYGGRLFSVVGVPKPQALADFPRGRSLHDVALGWAYLAKGARALEELRRIAGKVAELAATGGLSVPLERRVSFEQIPDALHASRVGHQRGRVVGIVDAALAAG